MITDKEIAEIPANKVVADNTASEALTVMVITAIVSWLSESAKGIGIQIHVETMVVIVTGLVSGITRGFMIWWIHYRRKEKKQDLNSKENKKEDN